MVYNKDVDRLKEAYEKYILYLCNEINLLSISLSDIDRERIKYQGEVLRNNIDNIIDEL